jgi:hypothetical protein
MKLGFFTALFLVFLTLKLTGYIAWSWWLVFAPIYAPFLIWLFFVVSIGIIAALLVLIDYVKKLN